MKRWAVSYIVYNTLLFMCSEHSTASIVSDCSYWHVQISHINVISAAVNVLLLSVHNITPALSFFCQQPEDTKTDFSFFFPFQ